jgi:hypothetical protein
MSEPTMTPYAAAKLVNQQLQDMGLEKTLPPQMLYTYVSKGYIKSNVVDGKKRVTNQQLADWFAGYVTKLTKGTTTVAVQVDEVVAEDDGTIGEWTEPADLNVEA